VVTAAAPSSFRGEIYHTRRDYHPRVIVGICLSYYIIIFHSPYIPRRTLAPPVYVKCTILSYLHTIQINIYIYIVYHSSASENGDNISLSTKQSPRLQPSTVTTSAITIIVRGRESDSAIPKRNIMHNGVRNSVLEVFFRCSFSTLARESIIISMVIKQPVRLFSKVFKPNVISHHTRWWFGPHYSHWYPCALPIYIFNSVIMYR